MTLVFAFVSFAGKKIGRLAKMKFKLAFFKVASYLLVYLLAFVTSVKLPKKVFRRSKGTKDRVKPYDPSYKFQVFGNS